MRCCERVVVAVDEGDTAALREQLRELADQSVDGPDPSLDEVQADAAALADRTADCGDDELPAAITREAKEVASRGCQWYLEQAEVDSAALPAAEAAADEVAAAAERLARDHAELEAESIILAAQAKTAAAERTAAVEALEAVMDQVMEAETTSSWLEETADLEGAIEQEREHRRRKEQLDEQLAEIREDLNPD